MYTYGDTLSRNKVKLDTMVLGELGYYVWKIVGIHQDEITFMAVDRLRNDPHPKNTEFNGFMTCSLDKLLSIGLRVVYQKECLFEET